MGGLCGNYNGDRTMNSSFLTTGGQKYQPVWCCLESEHRRGQMRDDCGDKCFVCDATKLQPFKATSSCGMITNPSGPFKACHSKVSPLDYFNHCSYDSCAVDGKDDILCKSLQAYAAVCQAMGVPIEPWRTGSFCPLSCPANSHYELCTRTCEQTCLGISAPTKCTQRCFEGCECNTGFVNDGEKCVTMDKCGCNFNGRYLSDGESFVTSNCLQRCKCQAGGVICEAITCRAKERCGLKNGVRGCYKEEGECLIKPQNLLTFDGLTGGPVGNGPLEVASLCKSDDDSWFRVLADVQSCGKGVPSIVRVHIFTQNTFITISKDKDIWVNGRSSSLPAKLPGIECNINDKILSVQLGTDLRVDFCESGEVKLLAAEGLAGALCGACGNFNDVSTDDLLAPGGKSVSNIAQLITSWTARDLYS
ncbi:hypothetical protein GDO86_012139, partial [Hymenochirus boettgeri]